MEPLCGILRIRHAGQAFGLLVKGGVEELWPLPPAQSLGYDSPSIGKADVASVVKKNHEPQNLCSSAISPPIVCTRLSTSLATCEYLPAARMSEILAQAWRMVV